MSHLELNPEEWQQFCQVMNGYIYSQTLATACDFNLFTYLSENSGATLDQLQESLNLSQYSTRVLMLSCCAVGLTEQDQETGGYSNTKIAETFFVKDAKYSMLPHVEFMEKIQQPCATNLTQSLKEERHAGLDIFPGSGDTLYQRFTEGYPEFERVFQASMGAFSRTYTKILNISELSVMQNLLDVAGGDGTNAIALCRRNANLKVTLIDIPEVRNIASQNIEKQGFEKQISCFGQDIFEQPWPEGDYDGILMSHLVGIFTPQKISFLYKKAFDALPKGGTLFIWVQTSDESGTGGVLAAQASIYLLSTASGEGMAYTPLEHEEWLRGAGFGEVRRYESREIDHCMFVAIK